MDAVVSPRKEDFRFECAREEEPENREGGWEEKRSAIVELPRAHGKINGKAGTINAIRPSLIFLGRCRP